MKRNYKIGPFKTEYHRNQVDTAFVGVLKRYLESEIFPHLNSQGKMTISLQTDFDDEKYLGPNSICKNRYKLLVNSTLGKNEESAQVIFNYYKEERLIKPMYGGPHIESVFTRKQINDDSRQLINVQKLVKDGHKEIPCPKCNEPLELSIVDTKKGPIASWIICNKNKCFRVHVNVRPKA